MNDEESEERLTNQIQRNLDTGRVVKAKLATSDRILARITDGIYRQPASALRELIANAYDADATNVYIETDFPRFSKISVRDDGSGLTIEGLSRLINHIGGSPKRTLAGVTLGIVNKNDPSLSPAGRRLIGKIGIGLFSVAQLTRHFQIITKTKGSNHRLVAEVVLKTYTEDDLTKFKFSNQARDPIETGDVQIQAFPAENKDSHGTEIILLNLKSQTKALLQSQDIWLRVDADIEAAQLGEGIKPPRYHIGRMEPGSEDLLRVSENLPWNRDDPPENRFAKMYQAVIDEVGVEESTPKLETLLDNYLRMLWTLSLSAPIDYINGHPFDLGSSDDLAYYQLSNSPKGQATKTTLRQSEKLRAKLDLRAPERGNKIPFQIFVDGVELRRPIRFKDLPRTGHAVKTPMLFVGKCSPDLSAISEDSRGGDLAFEAYFLWAPKIVPKENVGLMIRISDASGTLFDDSFIKYQISEQTRLKQITAEIFVLKGLDAALNIDRESFNYAHPHYQTLMKWVHSALRQLANTQKAVSTEVRTEAKKLEQRQSKKAVGTKIAEEIRHAGKDPETEAAEVVFEPGGSKKLAEKRSKGVLAFDPDVVLSPLPQSSRSTTGKQNKHELYEEMIKGVAQILDAYGVFEQMSYSRQQKLLRAILAVFVSVELKS